MTEEPTTLSNEDYVAVLRIVEQQQVEETAVEVVVNKMWRHPTDPDIFIVRIECPFCSRGHRHGWAGPPHKPGYRAAQCYTDDHVGEGYTLVIPDDLQASEPPRSRPGSRKRIEIEQSNMAYKVAIDGLKGPDWATYRAIVSRVESLKGIARRSKDRAIIAESRLLVAEAELNTRTTEMETN